MKPLELAPYTLPDPMNFPSLSKGLSFGGVQGLTFQKPAPIGMPDLSDIDDENIDDLLPPSLPPIMPSLSKNAAFNATPSFGPAIAPQIANQIPPGFSLPTSLLQDYDK